MSKIVLASKSPRRRRLLEKLKICFCVDPSDYDEEMDLDLSPIKLAAYLAQKKAEDVAARYQDEDVIIIGADTFAVVDGKVLGKARTKGQARDMLQKLSGKQHSVITGLALISPTSHLTSKVNSYWHLGKDDVFTEAFETKVYFKKLTDVEIEKYIETGEPLYKAGAYAIQGKGGKFVEKIEGDFDTVVGLPVKRLKSYLKRDNMI